MNGPMMDGSRRNAFTALVAAGLVALMIGVSFAAVPFYRWFCQVTGFGGTTQVAGSGSPAGTLDREVTVSLVASTHSDLEWSFAPLTRSVTLRVGEEALVFYRATNRSDTPLIGTSTFNVTPHKAGPYFAKIECFCFQEQRLEPGESIDMPVVFFVDPAIGENRNMDDVSHISLSYTFFRARTEPARQARAMPVETDRSSAPPL